MAEPTSNSSTKSVIPTQRVTPTRSGKRAIFFSRIKRRILKHVWLARIGSVAAIILGIYLVFSLAGFLLQKIGITNYPQLVADFVLTPADKIRSQDARTNIIILGKSGAGYDSPDLTDTMILASVSLTKPSITLISIPRDIWIPAIRAKINSAYYWGNQKQPGGGFILAKSEVEEVIGKPVQYGIVVNFNGFQKIIDAVNGIDVFVERSFVDSQYPIAGRENDACGGDPIFACRYETIKFDKGLQHMDGTTALKFVRSRHARGDEGNDLAREARQDKVITAIKNKILDPKIFLNPQKDITIWNIVRESVETDINGDAAAILVRKVIASGGKVSSRVIPEDFLENPPISPRYDNQYVFLPKAGDWSNVHDWADKLLQN